MTTDRVTTLTSPLPSTGRLGVATLWLVWFTGPMIIVLTFFDLPWTGIVSSAILLVGSVWIATSKNRFSAGRQPSGSLAALARLSPLVVLAIIVAGYVVATLTSAPASTVVAATLSLVFAIWITPRVAATPPRNSHS